MTEPITYEQVGFLLGLAAARDQRTVGDADILAWHADLNAAHITYADADAALTRYYAVEMARVQVEHRRRVTAPDVISIARKIRATRLENFHYEPEDLDETPAQYLKRLRAQIADIAEGRRDPAPLLASERDREAIGQLVSGVGRRVPNGDRP